MQDENAEAELIQRLLRISGQTQAQLADAAGVHQSTVSRVLECKKVFRQGKARARLIKHARNALRGDFAEGRDKVLLAFDSTWDGSEEHASAIARMIDAVANLRPSRG